MGCVLSTCPKCLLWFKFFFIFCPSLCILASVVYCLRSLFLIILCLRATLGEPEPELTFFFIFDVFML